MIKLRMNSIALWRRLVVLLSFLAAISFLLGHVCLWVTDTVIDSRRFGEITTRALTSEPVREAIAGVVVDRALEDYPIVQTFVRRPLEAAISGLLATALFSDALRGTAAEIHMLITTDSREQVVLRVGQAYQIIHGIVAVIDPNGVERLPYPEEVSEVVILTKETASPMRVAAGMIPFVAAGALLLGIALFLLAFWKAEDRRGIVRFAGFQLLFGSMLVLVFLPVIRISLTGGIEREVSRVVVDQGYRALTSSLAVRTWVLLAFALILVGVGYWLSWRRRVILAGRPPTSMSIATDEEPSPGQ
jgi:hypothetical protein